MKRKLTSPDLITMVRTLRSSVEPKSGKISPIIRQAVSINDDFVKEEPKGINLKV
jgi:hypothetical protein